VGANDNDRVAIYVIGFIKGNTGMSFYGLFWSLFVLLMFSVAIFSLYIVQSEKVKDKMLILIVLICISISFMLQGIAELSSASSVNALGYIFFYVAYLILNVSSNSLFRNSRYNFEENEFVVKYILATMNAFLIINLIVYLYW